MKKVLFGAVLVALLALSFAAGHWYTLRDADKNTSAGRRILYYVDPMNPAHTSDKPGLAPCGMKMEPVYADDGSPGQAPGSAMASMPPGTVKITPDKQQIIGIETAVVEKSAIDHLIRTTGRVAPDETRVYRLVASVDGWIRETYDNATGTLVKKDEHLASFYSPQFRAAQLAYFSILGSGADRFQAGGRQALAPSQQASISLQTYVDALEGLGMSGQQIKELAETRQYTDKIFIVAPATSFIIARNVSPGQRFDKGTEWYRLADLSKVWVLADLFRNEAGDIKPGMKVQVTLPHQEKEYHAMVSMVLPQFDPNSRSLKVRLELDNPGYVLKPDMFVDVEFTVTLPPRLVVPADALLDSGIKKTVFVDRGNGFFEPREVETGWRLGDKVEIKKGLMAGERIVVSGNFLIDSESRMKMAAAGMQATSQGPQAAQRPKDPVCGMIVHESEAMAAGLTSDWGGETYYFCSKECKEQFDEANRQPEEEASPDTPEQDDPGEDSMKPAVGIATDPVCGMIVHESEAMAAGLTSDWEGKTHYFCSKECKEQFDEANREPEEEASQDTPEQAAHGAHTKKPPVGIATDPVCGMIVHENEAKAARLTSDWEGKTHYFCSQECKDQFDEANRQPEEEAPPDAPEQAAPGADSMKPPVGIATDPVCGMIVHESKARAASLTSQHQDRTYYFCSKPCKDHFDAAPQRYAERARGMATKHGDSDRTGRSHD